MIVRKFDYMIVEPKERPQATSALVEDARLKRKFRTQIFGAISSFFRKRLDCAHATRRPWHRCTDVIGDLESPLQEIEIRILYALPPRNLERSKGEDSSEGRHHCGNNSKRVAKLARGFEVPKAMPNIDAEPR